MDEQERVRLAATRVGMGVGEIGDSSLLLLVLEL